MQPRSILDQFSAQRTVSTSFRPKSAAEVLTLRLAQKLGEGASAAYFTDLLANYSETQLLLAYKRTVKSGVQHQIGKRFHKELVSIPASASNGHFAKLLALRLERRAIGAAIFSGDRLEYTQARQLSSAKDKAVASAVGFVNWLCEQFSPDSAAIELISLSNPSQRQGVAEAMIQALRERMLPIWEVDWSRILAGFGYPALKSKPELRQVISDIWPVLSSSGAKRLIPDAVALGLYVQVERCFLH